MTQPSLSGKGRLICPPPFVMNWFRNPRFYVDGTPAVGLLFFRLIMGLGMLIHGFGKIQSPFSWMGPKAPVPGILQALAAASEFFGGAALLLGLLTPLAALAVMSVMFVATLANIKMGATYFVKTSPSLPGKDTELSVLYFLFGLTLFLTGPGIVSIDSLLFNRKKR